MSLFLSLIHILVTAVLVRIKLSAPVIFKQERPGLGGKIFTLYKFRTMTDQRDENGALLPDSVRLTSFGKRLRATSLDELPELINILNGTLSVVGLSLIHISQIFLEKSIGLSGGLQINFPAAHQIKPAHCRCV